MFKKKKKKARPADCRLFAPSPMRLVRPLRMTGKRPVYRNQRTATQTPLSKAGGY